MSDMPTDLSGYIVDILEKSSLQRVWVKKQNGAKLATVTAHGRIGKAPRKTVAFVHSGGVEEAKAAERIGEITASVESKVADVDVALLWEFCEEDPRDYEAAELAELVFTEPSSIDEAAVFDAVVLEGKRFKRVQQRFSPRNREQVDELELGERKRREREEREGRIDTWIDELLASAAPVERTETNTDAAFPDGEPHLADDLDAILGGDNSSVLRRRIVSRVGVEKCVDATFRMMRRLGRIPGDVDPFVIRGGVPIRFPATVLEEAEALPEKPEGLDAREDWTAVPTFSIDDAETREIDDALSVELAADGGARVAIHIADCAAFVQPGSKIDEEARDRAVTTYLPRGITTMLPTRIGHELGSLVAGADRPAVSFVARVSKDGEVLESHFARTRICVDDRMTYEDADASVAEEADARWPTEMAFLDRFARAREQVRASNGAVSIDRPDLRVSADADGEISVRAVMPTTPSYRIVGESMILFNAEAARYFVEKEIPALFRVQEVADGPEPPASPGPLDIEELVRRMKPSRVSTVAGRHGGLGLDAYVQITSPLRRYADAILQRQLVSFLESGEPALDLDALTREGAAIDETARARTVLERRAKRHYVLRWLQSHDDAREYDAVALRNDATGQTVCELAEWPIRGTLVRGESARPGERLRCRIAVIDDESGTLRLHVASRPDEDLADEDLADGESADGAAHDGAAGDGADPRASSS